MSEKIVYLLGAGASANAIPVAGKLAADIATQARAIESLLPYTVPANAAIQLLNSIHKDIAALAEAASSYATVDTLARSYYLRKKPHDLQRLKRGLSLYLMLREAISEPETRYQSFIAYLLDRDEQGTPFGLSNVSFISWNYDTQIERNVMRLMGWGADEAYRLAQLLKIPATDEIELKTLNRREFGFGLLKLNGTAGLHHSDTRLWHYGYPTIVLSNVKLLGMADGEADSQAMANFAQFVAERVPDLEQFDPALHFAWEDSPFARSQRALATKILREATILICIGYSMPAFNRSVDRQLFGVTGNLKQIIVQDPVGSVAHAVVEKILAIRNAVIHTGPIPTTKVVENDGAFYIPAEL